MSLFHEEEINKEKFVGTSFLEVKVTLSISNKIDVNRDWINHENYIKNVLPKLKQIQTPQVGVKQNKPQIQQVVIDLETNTEERKTIPAESTIQAKPKLIPNKPRIFRQQLDINEIKFNANFGMAQQATILPEIDEVFKMHQVNFDSSDQDILNPNYNFFSKPDLRKLLLNSLTSLRNLPNFKQQVQQSSQYSTLHEGIFAHKSSLKFAQLNSQLQFIEKSNVSQDTFFALLIDNDSSLQHIAEYIIYNLVATQGNDVEYPYLYVLPLNSNEKFEIKQLGTETQKITGLDPNKNISEVRDICGIKEISKDQLLSQKQIQDIDDLINQETDNFGVMLYYGGCKLQTNSIYNERQYKIHLLQHVIIGLKTLQHKGSMVLKVCETYSNFTVSLIFILYRLFNQVLLAKPYASSPISSTQYLVCQGLREAKPKVLIPKLIQLFKKYQSEQTNGLDLDAIIESKMLENEEKLLQYVKKVNDATALYRKTVIEAAIDDIQPSENMLSETKEQCLSKWGLPIIAKKEGLNPRKSSQEAFLAANDPNYRATAGSEQTHVGINRISQEDQYRQPSEEELMRQKRMADKVGEDFLMHITANKHNSQKQIDQEKLDEERRRRRKEHEKRLAEKKKEELKQKLQQSLQGKKKTSSSGVNSQKARNPKDEQQEKKAVVVGDKILIPIAAQPANEPLIKQEFKEKKRDEKRSDKQQEHTIKTKTEQEGQARKQSRDLNELEEASQQRKRPKLEDTQDAKDHHQKVKQEENQDVKDLKKKQKVKVESEDEEMMEDQEENRRALQERIEKSKKEDQQRIQQFKDPSMLEKLKQYIPKNE